MTDEVDPFHVKGIDGILRPLDEHYDGQRDVEQDPYGAWLAIQNQAGRIRELQAGLDARISAVLEEVISTLRTYEHQDGAIDSPDWEVEQIYDDIRIIRTDAMQALDRVRREARVEALREAWNACDPTSYRAHHASVRKRCQKAIEALIAAEERGEGD